MALCAAGLIGLGVTSANADLAFNFDILDLKLNAGDAATSVAGQGYNQVLIAPNMVVGLQLNGTVIASPPGAGAPIGEQRALWSTNGAFQTTASGAKVDLSGAGASLLFTANIAPGGVAGTYTVPAIAPFVSSGTTVGAATDVGSDGDADLTNVWMRQAPVTATDLGSGNWTYNTPTPNAQNATSATWYVAKVNAAAQAAPGTGTTTVRYQPAAGEDGVLFVDNSGVKTGTTGVVTSAGIDLLSGPTITVTGKAVTKIGASGAALTALNVSDAASLTIAGGGVMKAGSLSLGTGSNLELGQSGLIVDAGGNLGVFNAILSGKLTSAASSDSMGLGYSLGSNPDLAGNNGTFGGQAFGGTSVLVKLTKFGDANLDGDVDLSDVNSWIGNFTGTIDNPAAPVKFWADGDWDTDGDVDLSDVNLWITNFTGTVDGPLSVFNASASPEAIAAAASVGISVVVPEPASITLLGLGAIGLLARRNRRK